MSQRVEAAMALLKARMDQHSHVSRAQAAKLLGVKQPTAQMYLRLYELRYPNVMLVGRRGMVRLAEQQPMTAGQVQQPDDGHQADNGRGDPPKRRRKRNLLEHPPEDGHNQQADDKADQKPEHVGTTNSEGIGS